MNKIYLIEGNASQAYYSYDVLITNKKERALVLALNSIAQHCIPLIADHLNDLTWNQIRSIPFQVQYQLTLGAINRGNEISFKDLPLYISWPYKSPEFLDLIKYGACHV